MSDSPEPERPDDPRREAQERLSRAEPADQECICATDALALLHELRVHQIELELQNEELQHAREELEERVEQRTKELEDANARLASILESITDCHFSVDSHWRFIEINPAAERTVFHRPASELLGKNIWSEYPQAVDSEFYRQYLTAASENRPVHFEGTSRISPGKWFEGHAYPHPDRLEVYLRDITERKESEARQQAFYRRTILAATQGKLVITDAIEIHKLASSPLNEWEIRSLDDLSLVRDDAVAIAESSGMDKLGAHMLTTCVVEGISNVLKHAGRGKASLHQAEDGLMLLIEDAGPGMGTMDLPDVALRHGYSTAGTLGMGYKLMIASCRKLYLATGPDGTTAAFDIPLHNPDPAV